MSGDAPVPPSANPETQREGEASIARNEAIDARSSLSLEANSPANQPDPIQPANQDVSLQGFPRAAVNSGEIMFAAQGDPTSPRERPAATTDSADRSPPSRVEKLKEIFPFSGSFPDADRFFSGIISAADRIAAANPSDVQNVFSETLRQSLRDNPNAPSDLFSRALNGAFSQNPDTAHLRVTTTSNLAQLRDARAVTPINPEGEVAVAVHNPEPGMTSPLSPAERTLAANIGQDLAKMIDSGLDQVKPDQAKPFESIFDQLVGRQEAAGLFAQMPEIGARQRPESPQSPAAQLLDLLNKRPTIFNEVGDRQALARETLALAEAVAFANPQDMPGAAISALNFLATNHKVANGKDLGTLFSTALNIVTASQDFSLSTVSSKNIDMAELADKRLANPANPSGVFSVAAFHTSIDPAALDTVRLANQTATNFATTIRNTARNEGQVQLSDSLLSRIGRIVNLAPR